MDDLSGKQRRYLRGQGNTIKPTVYMGKDGISDALLLSLGEAFNNRELIKVRLEKSCDLERKAAGQQLAQAASAHLVQVLGHTLLLYRPDPEEPVIKLPQ
jgi:RNA-binding protein